MRILILLLISAIWCEKLFDQSGGIRKDLNIQNSCIVSVIGQARVGKSTFINKYLNLQKALTSDTTESCTKEIDIYSHAGITFLDVEGDDLGNLSRNLYLAKFVAAVSQIVIYYSRDKVSVHSAQTLEYIRLHSSARIIKFIRTDLKVLDDAYSFKNVDEILPRIRKIISSLPRLPGHVIFQTLVQNVNVRVPKLLSVVETEMDCAGKVSRCLNGGECESCGDENFDKKMRREINRRNKVRDEERIMYARMEQRVVDAALGGLGAAALLMLSDHSLKKNIEPVLAENKCMVASFCWRWKFGFGDVKCGHLVGKCFDEIRLNKYGAEVREREFLGVFFAV